MLKPLVTLGGVQLGRRDPSFVFPGLVVAADETFLRVLAQFEDLSREHDYCELDAGGGRVDLIGWEEANRYEDLTGIALQRWKCTAETFVLAFKSPPVEFIIVSRREKHQSDEGAEHEHFDDELATLEGAAIECFESPYYKTFDAAFEERVAAIEQAERDRFEQSPASESFGTGLDVYKDETGFGAIYNGVRSAFDSREGSAWRLLRVMLGVQMGESLPTKTAAERAGSTTKKPLDWAWNRHYEINTRLGLLPVGSRLSVDRKSNAICWENLPENGRSAP